MSDDIKNDQEMRQAAFLLLSRKLDLRDQLSSQDLKLGFQFGGRRIPLVNPQRGIFKPKEMRYLLSIRTVVPKVGGRVWYDDQRDAHRQVFDGDELVDYAFMGRNPDALENRWLREAMAHRVPVIYFLGTQPGWCQPIFPTFVVDWNATALKAKIAFGLPGESHAGAVETQAERRYALREVKVRLHQATFRSAVIAAYGGRCALSALPETSLLDAAHIAADGDEKFGQPIITNGIPLTKLHHAAFDGHLLGISPDYKVVVSDRLLSIQDGPTLESLKRLNGNTLILPARRKDYPDRERLAIRFESFRKST